MKTNQTISLDTEVVIEAREKIKNISTVINEFLREYLKFKRESPGNSQEELNNQVIQMKAMLASKEQELEKEKAKKEKKTKVFIKGPENV